MKRIVRKAIWLTNVDSEVMNSRSNLAAGLSRLAELGLVDELVLQVYRDDLGAFERELRKPEVRSIKFKIPTLIGILTGLRTKPIPTDLIQSQVEMMNAHRFAGCACFFYETLWHEQL